ncbi:deoxyribodipyrimidine photo-lyase, partial [Thioclava sp. BHET1]
LGLRLILRRGTAQEALEALIAETGASAVWWGRLYDAPSRERDSALKSTLKARGIDARSFTGFLLHEPWTVETGQGGYYKVYTPYWKAVRGREIGACLAPPKACKAPGQWPQSAALESFGLGAAMRRGAAVLERYIGLGEAEAQHRLDRFLQERVESYREARDFPARGATSELSENLAYGEISPRRIWHRGWRAMEEGARGAEHFLKELVWREFAWHLFYHCPEMDRDNWRAEWQAFPWRGEGPEAERWRRGMTGEPFVDAAMREIYVTGRMHNRARMIVASYLTKHLLIDWRLGLEWFADCLTDWDPAANAMGWQWVAGSGPDAAPYFRVFNPAGQAEKFDPNGDDRAMFIAEGHREPADPALDFFRAVPKSWQLDPKAEYPVPMIDLKAGRERALAAYQGLKSE